MRMVPLGLIALGLTLATTTASADPVPSPTRPQLFLRFTVVTGNDDLRGGQDNVRATLVFDGAPGQTWMLNQRGMRWADRTTHQTTVPLPRGVGINQIRRAILRTTFRGGLNGDNWNMTSITVEVTDEQKRLYVVMGRAGPKRFTARDQSLDVPLAPPFAAEPDPGKGI